MALTDHERDLITRAREVGPALRASTSDRDRLAGWLLAELADLTERLTQRLADEQEQAHALTIAQNSGEMPLISRDYRGMFRLMDRDQARKVVEEYEAMPLDQRRLGSLTSIEVRRIFNEIHGETGSC